MIAMTNLYFLRRFQNGKIAKIKISPGPKSAFQQITAPSNPPKIIPSIVVKKKK
jgi:hypothetical protein